jgi:uncharacterized repeat protein (TIGR01451 family)
MRPDPARKGRLAAARPGFLLAAALLLGGASARADEVAGPGGGDGPVATGSAPLETTIVAESLQVDARPDGSEARAWSPATRLSAGDDVYYTIRVHNPGKAPVTDVVVTKRLPFGVHYKRGSAVGPACKVQFSADGGTTFVADSPPKGGGTSTSKRTAPAAEYTHVRWILSRPLAPGATALLRFRASFS